MRSSALRIPADVLVAAAALLAWVSGIDGVFQFDDFNVIVDNPAVHSWAAWWASMPGIRPLLKASYTFNVTLGGSLPGFHLVNGGLHLVNALLVRRIVERLLLGTGMVAGRCRHSALWSAILFAVHPAQTEVVTYLSGRSNALMALFLFAAVLAHAHAWESTAPKRWRLLGAVAFLAALAAKESAWSLPLIVAACERIAGRADWRETFTRTAALWSVLVLLGLAVLIVPGYGRLLDASLATRTLGRNLLAQVDGLWYLVSGPLTGTALNIDPDLRVSPVLGAGGMAKACAMLAAVGGVWYAGRSRPWLRLGLLWFGSALAATNSVLPRIDIANDRALYVPLVGAAWLLVALVETSLRPRPALVLGSVVVVALLAATTLRNRDYRSEVALWTATARASPAKARVWNNLGYSLERAGRTEGARVAYRRALALDPGDVKARTNLELMDAMR